MGGWGNLAPALCIHYTRCCANQIKKQLASTELVHNNNIIMCAFVAYYVVYKEARGHTRVQSIKQKELSLFMFESTDPTLVYND